MIFGKLFKLTSPIRWGRRQTSPGQWSYGFEMPIGTAGLAIANLDKLPLPIAEREALRECARRHAAAGKPGIVAMINDVFRFIEATDFQYVDSNRATLFQTTEIEA